MGCSSSSTQTVAQENRPGTKPEETSADTGFATSNGVVAEDAETIADQMQLPLQSALPEELGPGPGSDDSIAACEDMQNVEIVAEQVASESEPTVESDLMQVTKVPESAAPEEQAAATEPHTLHEDSSPELLITVQEATVISAALEETSPAEAPATAESIEADTAVEAVPTEESEVSSVPAETVAVVEAASEATPVLEETTTEPEPASVIEPSPVSEPTAAPEPAPVVEAMPVVEVTPAAESTTAPEPTPAAESTTAPEPTPTAEPTTAPEPTATAEPTTAPEPTATAEPTTAPGPTPTAEPAPAPEPTLVVESTPAPGPIPTETLVAAEADSCAVEDPAAVELQLEPKAPDDLEPVHVEPVTAAAAAAVVLQAAQEQAALAATTDENTPDQPAVQAPEVTEGGEGVGAVLQAETDEAKIPVALTEADMAAATEE